MRKTETHDTFLKQNPANRAALAFACSVLAFAGILSPAQSASGAGLSNCESQFETFDYDRNNLDLHYRYKQIEGEYYPHSDSSFRTNRDGYVSSMKHERTWNWGTYYINRGGFSESLTERMYLLWNREPSPADKQAIGQRLQEIDRLQGKLPDWRDISSAQKSSPRAAELLAKAAPKKDGQNIKKNSDLQNWDEAMRLATKMANNRRDLTKEDLAHLAVAIQGNTQHPSESMRYPNVYLARYLKGEDVNFMFTKSPGGRRTLDPLNTFIPGREKEAALKHFLSWLRQSRTTMHPVIAAARARQFIVSVHPLWDSNGRLARIVANYVLMRAGYPPASIPRGTETENVSVALFPLRDFKDQISPEDSIQIMIDGVRRSQQTLLE